LRASASAATRVLLRTERFLAQVCIDSRLPQILGDPPCAKAPAAQTGAAHAGIALVADIARAGHALDHGLHVGRRGGVLVPAAFAQFAGQIGGQLAGAGGKTGDIGQRQFIESGRIERMGANGRTVATI
jgi:hypothetical protein